MKHKQGKPTQKRRLIQVAAGTSPGDAITNDILAIDGFFNKKNSIFAATRIYAGAIDPRLRNLVRPIHLLEAQDSDLLLVHYGARIPYLSRILASEAPAMLIYHNITPAQFYEPYNLKTAGELREARRELWSLGSRFCASFADSLVNKKELECYGFSNVHLRPIAIPFLKQKPLSKVSGSSATSQNKKTILFTGRISPNKGHTHLIKAFYLLNQRRPESRLIFAGRIPADIPAYYHSLRSLIASLGIAEKVLFKGFLPEEELMDLYKKADLFACFSEHEGFCVPLLEAMFYGVPVLALDALHSAVRDTMQNAGVLFRLSESQAKKPGPPPTLAKESQLLLFGNNCYFPPLPKHTTKKAEETFWPKKAFWSEKDYLRASLLMEEMLLNESLRKALTQRQWERLQGYDMQSGLQMIEQELKEACHAL